MSTESKRCPDSTAESSSLVHCECIKMFVVCQQCLDKRSGFVLSELMPKFGEPALRVGEWFLFACK